MNWLGHKGLWAAMLIVALIAWASAGWTLVRWFNASRTLQGMAAAIVAVDTRPGSPEKVEVVIRLSNGGRVQSRLLRVSARLHHPEGLLASTYQMVDEGFMEPRGSVEVAVPFQSRLAPEHLPQYDASTPWRVEMVISVVQPVFRGTHKLDFTMHWDPSGEEGP